MIVVDRNFRIELSFVLFFFFLTLKCCTCIVAYFSNVFLYKRSRIFRRYKKWIGIAEKNKVVEFMVNFIPDVLSTSDNAV